jgi:hypothetical protein
MLKKLSKLSLIFLLLFPVFATGKTFYVENISKIVNYENNLKLGNKKDASTINNVLYTEIIGYSNELNYYHLIVIDDIMKEKQYSKRPSLNLINIGGEIFSGCLIGGVFFITSALVIVLKDLDRFLSDLSFGNSTDGASDLEVFIMGSSYIIGSTIGVNFAGNLFNEKANFLATLTGGTLGMLIGLAIPHYLWEGYEPFGFIPGVPIGATIGFNLTRRYKIPPTSEPGLINFNNSKMSFNIPNINIRPDPFNKEKLYQNIDLVTIKF